MTGEILDNELSLSGPITLAALGDLIISRKVSEYKDQKFQDILSLLNKADCVWANCETPFITSENLIPRDKEYDINIFCEEWGAYEYKQLGIDMVGLANNHILDYGYPGLLSTIKQLHAQSLCFAGAGNNLEEASAPKYFKTPFGVIGQINCAESFHPGTEALSKSNTEDRPGLNPFGVKKDIKNGNKTEEINIEDFNRIKVSIGIARAKSRLVIASIHSHGYLNNEDFPPRYLEIFARNCIDAGADIVINTGPHKLGPIEIYKNKPIFYSLGHFMVQYFDRLPPKNFVLLGQNEKKIDSFTLSKIIFNYLFHNDSYYQTVIPLMTFAADNKLSDINLVPISLIRDENRGALPQIAFAAESEKIFNELKMSSKIYKTEIKIENNKGIIKI